LHRLTEEDRQQLWQESALLSNWMEQIFAPDSMNVAALGNIVSQLHLHHVARYQVDAAWPGPVWGYAKADPYLDGEIEAIRGRVVMAFEGELRQD
ncbi:MAG: HIT domain-containing protein, partial [Anaerolineales bacterium]